MKLILFIIGISAVAYIVDKIQEKLIEDELKEPNEFRHCKTCEYKKRAYVNEKGFLICPASGMEITDDDFCSYYEVGEQIG